MRITGFFTSPRSVVVARCTQMAKGVGHVEATLKADAPTRQSPLGPHKRPLVREAEGAGLPGRAEMCASVKKGRTVKTHPRQLRYPCYELTRTVQVVANTASNTTNNQGAPGLRLWSRPQVAEARARHP